MSKKWFLTGGITIAAILLLLLFWNRYDFKIDRRLVYRMNRFTGQVDWARIGSNQWESLGNSEMEDWVAQNKNLFLTNQQLAAENKKLRDSLESLPKPKGVTLDELEREAGIIRDSSGKIIQGKPKGDSIKQLYKEAGLPFLDTAKQPRRKK